MNGKRRKSLGKIMSQIEGLKQQLEEIRDEEQQTCDNIPEAFADQIAKSEGVIEEIEDTIIILEDAINSLIYVINE